MSFLATVHDATYSLQDLITRVKDKEVVLTDVMLADIVDQYTTYGHEHELSAEETSTFLQDLSQLLLMKSKALLPLDDQEEEQDKLQDQLERFEHYKQLKLFLDELEAKNERSFSRQLVPQIEEKVALEEVLEGVSLDDLSKAFYDVLQRFEERQEEELPQTSVEQEQWTVEQKIEALTELVKKKRQFTFQQIFEQAASRLEIICTFLALLELLKQRIVQVNQEGVFGEMMIERI
jgi:segregation and condensation protein A